MHRRRALIQSAKTNYRVSYFYLNLLFLLLFLTTRFEPVFPADSLRVTFRLKWERPAKKIALIGSFNQFNKNVDLLQGPDSAGVWWLEKKLPFGTYEYRFLVDDKIYLRDPENPFYGGKHSNSLLYLDPPEKPHIELIEPLPGQRVTELPLPVKIRFQPGTQSPQPDVTRSICRIDGQAYDLKYLPGEKLLQAVAGNLHEGEHRLKIAVQDEKGNRARELQSIFVVNARNQPPVAEAGYSQFCRVGERIRLNGGLSCDPDLDDLTDFRWCVLDNPAAVDFDSTQNTPFPFAYFRQPGNYRVELRVSDGTVWSKPDTTTVFCADFPQTTASFHLKETKVPQYLPLHSVTVAGEFNRWQAAADSLSDADHDGVWTLTRSLRPGQYEYKFVLNGEHWIPDPENPRQVEDGWEGVNSVLQVHPFFPDSISWRLLPGERGVRIENSLNRPFRLWQDANNPVQIPFSNDSLLTAELPGGNYFIYFTLREKDRLRPPAAFLLKKSDSGAIRILDFRQSPGWARSAVTYLIYLQAFGPDSVHPGTLKYLRQKLDYLQNLGVTCLWLMPIMESPTEHGYTPTDYFSIEKNYGTLADFDSLIADLHHRGMKLIFDFVANHTSDQHPYFLSAWWNPHSMFRHWYLWDGPRQYRFHNDWDQLPNLNYDNPNVRNYILKVAKFWIDRGVDGFRCDAAWGVPHDFWKDFRRRVKSWNPQVVLLDEVLPRDPAYHDLEFDMSYDTDFYGNVLDVFRGRKSVQALRFGLRKTRINYPPQVVDFRYLENQDMPRFIAQFGEDATRAAATLLFTLPGMPLVYYGQEIGLQETRQPMRWEEVGNRLYRFYRELIRLRREHPAFTSRQLNFLDTSHPRRVLAYLREGGGERFLVLINFSSREVLTKVKNPPEGNYSFVFSSPDATFEPLQFSTSEIHLPGYGYLILLLE